MDEEKLIKQKIKATRERKGYTRKEMAERLNLSVQGYSNLETGQTSLFTKSFRAFAEETEIPICELVSGLSYSEIETLTGMKEKYEQRLELMERGFRHEIDARKFIAKGSFSRFCDDPVLHQEWKDVYKEINGRILFNPCLSWYNRKMFILNWFRLTSKYYSMTGAVRRLFRKNENHAL